MDEKGKVDRWNEYPVPAAATKPLAAENQQGPLRTFVERDRFRRGKLIFKAYEEARLAGRDDEAASLLKQWHSVLRADHLKAAPR